MIKELIVTIFTLVSGLTQSPALQPISNGLVSVAQKPKEQVLARREFSLEKRYAVESVNEVMKKNILLNIAYLDGRVASKQDIAWDEVVKPFHSEFVLEAGKTFAYHEIVRNEYKGNLALTAKTNFNASDGYLSDGYLYGDGVCHLASLMNWAAQDAGLNVVVPKDHRSVGPINEVPDEYGVSIYKDAAANIGANNNLYITNTKDEAVKFHFNYDGEQLAIYVTELG